MRKQSIRLACAVALSVCAASAAIIVNPGFEEPAGTSDPAAGWVDTSTTYGSNRCSIADCGNGGGTTGPNSGSFWIWLGGTSSSETGIVSQTVTIPASASADFGFYLWYGTSSGSADDVFTASIDSVQLLQLLGNDPTTGGYQYFSYDVSAYADGGSHTIEFQLQKVSTTSGMNISIDDVSLTAGSAVPEPSTFALSGAALAGLSLFLRRRK